MDRGDVLFLTGALAPVTSMLLASLLPGLSSVPTAKLWRTFGILSGAAMLGTCVAICTGPHTQDALPMLNASRFGLAVAVLVQLLGSVIGGFSARYLEGEPGQRRYLAALAAVLAAVHLLLMADHWAILIVAWILVGVAMQYLLCFYSDRPFALLAAHKKRIADRAADVLLIGAAILAWRETGSGSLSDLWAYVGPEGASTTLHISAACLVLAVILRTALLPVHGWLIQVMEAPTPVSALLHAGVVNLGGFVLIRFAPLLEHATVARSLLIAFGLGSAVLAGLVMLTRISIKVRLAWSTTAQMGFMVLECGLGLYTFAALHLIGHSLYKAHAFLSASMAVRQTRLQEMRGSMTPAPISLLLAPAFTVPAVMSVPLMWGSTSWPWWWGATLGLAWAPVLWTPAPQAGIRTFCLHALSGLLTLLALTSLAILAHKLPLGTRDAPDLAFGVVALLGMAAMYSCLVVRQRRPQALRSWRRWSYAGFYVDELYTRTALRCWPTRWASATPRAPRPDTSSFGKVATPN